MNVRALECIVALADKRHFGQAADACSISQPALSGQIRNLEDRLGVTLFERTNKSVTVTPVGAEIVQQARIMLEQLDHMLALARARQAPLTGDLRLGVIPTLAPYLLPWIMEPLARRFPRLRLALREDMTEHLVAALHRKEIDAALVALPLDDPDLDELPLFREPFWLAYPPDHPLGTKPEIEAGDLERADLLLLSEGHCLRDQALAVCDRRNGNGRGRAGDLSATSLETLRQMVAAGYGCTLLPALTLHGPRRRAAAMGARPIGLPMAERLIGFACRRSFSRREDLSLLGDLIVGELPPVVARAETPAESVAAAAE